jgi:YYY domain-containing protein
VALILGAFLRLSGLHWDASVHAEPGRPPVVQEQHLHPDERFLTMVTAALEWPPSWRDYLDTGRSALNPHNRGFAFFPYGTLPIFLTKAVADGLGHGGFDRLHIVGRVLSSLADLATVAVTFALGQYLYGSAVGVLAALLLALAALPIQQAHFFTSDTFAAAFVALALLRLARIAGEERVGLGDHLELGIALGAALACKASAALLLFPAALAIWVRWFRFPGSGRSLVRFGSWVAIGSATGLVAFLVFRLLHPYAFQGPGLLDVWPNGRWLANMREIGEMMAGLRDVPPGHQWTDRPPLWFPWWNMVTVGMGPALGLAAWGGWALAGWELARREPRRWAHLVPWSWVLVVFLHQGTQWVKSIRYFLPIYPALALFAAYLIVWAWRRAAAGAAPSRRATWRRAAAGTLAVLVVGGTLAWAWAFTSIYRRPHSRVEASRWIYAHVPPGAALANEHWDDGLPLHVDGRNGSIYRHLELPLYAEDGPDKLEMVLRALDGADYVILSSNRLSDSIPRLPMRFPMGTLYYRYLFSGELGFDRVAEFTSYPTLFGVAVPDQWAEEAFSVYDHPRVQIFRKAPTWNLALARARLSQVDWAEIQQLTPREVEAFKGGLRLSPATQAVQADAGTWSRHLRADGLYDRMAFGNRWPVLVWCLALALLGLLAFPLAALAFRAFEDRGWLVSKALGLLLVGVMAWLLGSSGLMRFGGRAVWTAVAALAALSLAATWLGRAELRRVLRGRRARLLAEEALFWLAFAAMLWLRWQNPDLWHPDRGGEKPMDFAYLNAVLKSAAFPPYDPWFAGGYLNYYYFGFVLVAVLVKLTGIIPAVAYNLAVPTFFALTVAGSFTAAAALGAGLGAGIGASRRRLVSLGSGLAGAIFVGVLGNLTEVHLLFEAAQRALPVEWWYWNATRAIPHPPTESGPITEFPFFTFLFGDLHAHMMALPYALMVLALAIQLVLQADTPSGTGEAAERIGAAATFGVLGIATGVLWPLNTWDFPTYFGLVAIGLVIRQAGRQRLMDFAAWTAAAWRLLAVAAVGRLAFQPFFATFGTTYGAVELWHGSRTPLGPFLLVHGFFLFCLGSALIASLWSGLRLTPLARRILMAGAVVAAGLAGAGLGVDALLAGLATLALAHLARPDRTGAERMFACLALAGAGLAGAVEHVVLRGDIGRMNTVFKLYFQIWVVWGVGAAASLAYMRSLVATRRPVPDLVRLWGVAGIALLAGALLYPVLATPARLRDRFDGVQGSGLDGQAFMARAVVRDQGVPVSLAGDAAALRWLEENVPGSPVIVEASIPPYRWGSRVSVHTGLPTIVGWDWHQRQQRAVLKGDPVGRRLAHVRTIYTSQDVEVVESLLRRYGARYVYVGALERLHYPGNGPSTFDRHPERFERVYADSHVAIYRLREP